MEHILKNIESNRDRYMEELFEFLSIPSISSSNKHDDDTRKAAEWLVENIRKAGIEKVSLKETAGHPLIYGEWLGAGDDAETVLIYGHYDVQPVDPLDLWDADPFKPYIKNGKIYGRGTSDDKGQLFAHIKAIEAHFKENGKLPVNVKLFIEGEEECGGENSDKFIIENKEMLKCDTVLISDTEWFAKGLPSICYSLRGISFVEIEVRGPNRDLHSGTYGGAVDNPINVLCWMAANLKDRYGRITIPGFYDDVLSLSHEEREGFKKLPFDLQEYKNELGVRHLFGENEYTTLERTWARPALDINGIIGGFTGRGAKTVIPSVASAKISMRLVPNQNAQDISAKIKAYLEEIAPPTVNVKVDVLHGGNPVLAPRDSKGVKAAMSSLKKAFGTEVVFMREGGSIPICETFGEALRAPVVLMGLGLTDDNIHSPNESFAVDNFFGGIKASALFLDEYSKL